MILFDITTSFQFRHLRPVGILRVEREILIALRERLGDQLCCVIYDGATHAFYRAPDELLRELMQDIAPHPVVRAEKASSQRRSWARVWRFLWNSSRRTRSVPTSGAAGIRLRDQIFAEELLRLSMEEYGMLRQTVQRLGKYSGRFLGRAEFLDSLNHRAHYGLLSTTSDSIYNEENRLRPEAAGPHHYVSAGTFWGDERYRLAWEMRAEQGWTLHYLIYDLIPILWHHVAEPHTREVFPLSLHWLLWGVDQLWTISETTKQDLLTHIQNHGYPEPDPNWLRSVPLGCEIATPPRADEAARAWLSGQGLGPDGYVLMVGTLEPRKNHDFAYRLWRELNLRHPGRVMPLVWVGQPGWAISAFLEMLRNDMGLPQGAIRVMSNVDDLDLATLYDNCRYTIYPSHYEGWGLPVVESLYFNKPCLTSDAPALNEAAEGHNEAISLFDGERWLARLFELMQDDWALEAAKQQISGFEGYSWARFRGEIGSDLDRFLSQDLAELRRAS